MSTRSQTHHDAHTSGHQHSSCDTPSYHLFSAFHHKSTLWLPHLTVTDVPTNTMNICYLTGAPATSKYCSHKYHEHLLSPPFPSITKGTWEGQGTKHKHLWVRWSLTYVLYFGSCARKQCCIVYHCDLSRTMHSSTGVVYYIVPL